MSSTQDPAKKVVILLHDLGEGGMQTVCMNLAQAFSAKAAVEVTLLLSNRVGGLRRRMPETVDSTDLGLPFQLSFKYILRLTGALVRFLRRSKPDVILANLPFLNFIVPLAKILALSQVSIISVEHTLPLRQSLEQEENHKISPRLIDFVEKLSRYCSSRSDYIVVPSHGVAQQLVQSMGISACRQERLRVIYNPVVDSWLYQKSQAAIAHPWFQVDQPPVILAVGRLTAQKDYETLLKSFAIVRQRLCVRLIIFGDGPMRDQLEALVRSLAIEDDVLLPGFVDNPYAYMGRASVFVLSSVWETFGMVLVEALACGCPVVSTDCDYGPAEILENGRYGRLVPVKAVDEIAHALEASLQATHDRDLLQRRAQDFSLEQSVRQYLELMGIVDSTPSSRPMADCVTPDVS